MSNEVINNAHEVINNANETIGNAVEQSKKTLENLMPSKQQQRKIVKAGLIGTMGVLAVSGLTHLPFKKHVHLVAGVGMVGFALWHYCLNTPKKK